MKTEKPLNDNLEMYEASEEVRSQLFPIAKTNHDFENLQAYIEYLETIETLANLLVSRFANHSETGNVIVESGHFEALKKALK